MHQFGRGWVALLVSLALTGCVDAQVVAPTATKSPVVSTGIMPTQSPAPTATQAPTAPPTPEPPLCADVAGRVERTVLTIPQQPKPMAVRVYLPPCYSADHPGGYPVLFLLHGLNFNEEQWERIGVARTADDLILAGELSPFLVVMPQEVYWRVPPADSNYIEVLLDAVVPWVEQTYAACTDRSCRAVGGLSRGGGWALHLGVLHPDVFSAIGLHSPASFYGDTVRLPGWLKAIPQDLQPRIWLDYGRSDPEAPESEALEKLLAEAGIPYQYYRNVGAHDEKYWSAHLDEYLRWYAAEWSLP